MPSIAEEAISAANKAVFTRAQRNENLSGMGTTLVGLVVRERNVWVLTSATAAATGCANANWSNSRWIIPWWKSRFGWAG